MAIILVQLNSFWKPDGAFSDAEVTCVSISPEHRKATEHACESTNACELHFPHQTDIYDKISPLLTFAGNKNDQVT